MSSHEESGSYEMLPVNPEEATSVKSPGPPTALVTDATTPEPPQRPPGIWGQWWTEILSCVLMIAMLFAIVGVLQSNSGKPLPDWPFAISINTVVSILSTVLKTSAALILAEGVSDLKWGWFQESRSLHDFVIFDSASRGPWGCVQLLSAPRGFVASLGAALVVLTLALDPFTQQLVRHYDCKQVSVQQQAAIPRGTMYTEVAPPVGAGTWPPETPVLGFIDQGIYNTADVGKTPFTCPTGNCTFEEPFSTLGYCSTCEDMSSQLAFLNETIVSLIAGTNETYERLFVNTTLPSGSYAATGPSDQAESWFVMNATDDGWYDIIQASMAFPGAPEQWLTDHYYAYTMRLHENTNDTGCNTEYENSTWACSGFGGSGAARCKLDPCVKTYTASVQDGELREHLVSTHKNMFMTDWVSYPFWLAADLICAGPEVVSRLRDKGFRIGQNDVVIPWNVMVNSSDGTASIWAGKMAEGWRSYSNNVTVPGPEINSTGLPLDVIPPECIYYMSYTSVSAIRYHLDKYLSGAISPGPNGHSADGPAQTRAFYNDTYASFDSVNRTFAGIAEGITQRIRRHTAAGALPVAKPVLGTTWEQKTCVDVRWGFLAFPAAVVGLTTLFLAMIVGRAAFVPGHTAVAGWKSSPLPLAFLRLTADVSNVGSVGGAQRATTNLKEMEKAAKVTNARLNS